MSRVQDYTIKTGDQFFFDTNVWLCLYCTIANHAKWKQEAYAEFLQYAISRNCGIHINSLVYSEFINAWLNIEFNKWKEINKIATNNKKEFVGTAYHTNTVKAISSAVGLIDSITENNNDDFNAIGLSKPILDGLLARDFNDCYYIELAVRKRHIIVTDDSDIFRQDSRGVQILSART